MPTPNLKRRWFPLTAGRFLFGLLALEGGLLLSERHQWFAFNEHKGWTVLLAVAALGVVLLLLTLWLFVSLLFRWRFQFRLRSLLVLVVAIAIPCSWLAVEMQQARKQREAVEAIWKTGGRANYDFQCDASGFPETCRWRPPGPCWLRELLGEDFFFDVVTVQAHSSTTDGDMVHFDSLPRLKWLALLDTRITDAGLEHLQGLTELQWLTLSETQVTDSGLRYLEGLGQLKHLALSNTKVTDSGLAHLKGLTRLEELNLSFTEITDAGVEHLKGLTRLRELEFCYTQVTAEGGKNLQQAFPTCQIIR